MSVYKIRNYDIDDLNRKTSIYRQTINNQKSPEAKITFNNLCYGIKHKWYIKYLQSINITCDNDVYKMQL